MINILLAEAVSTPALGTWTSVKNGTATIEWTIGTARIHVCSSEGDIADSYITVPYFSTEPAKEIKITLKYQLRDCASFNSHCSLKIGVYVKREDSNLLSSPNPTNTEFTFSGFFTNTSAFPSTPGNTEFSSTIKLGMKGKKGAYLSFRDLGICGAILGLTVSYTICPTISGDLVNFQETSAPNSTVAFEHVYGNCVKDSIAVTSDLNNYMKCYSNGTAQYYGKCHCEAGFERKGDACNDCKPKYYKSIVGNQACTKCGLNVQDGKAPRIEMCKCKNGFFRPTAYIHDATKNCEKPPSQPQNLNVLKVTSNSAEVTWQPPSITGTGNVIKYKVETICKEGCKPPIQNVITANLSITLSKLNNYNNYTMNIYSINNVTNATGKENSASITFRTQSGVPSEVQSVAVIRNHDGSVTIKWKEPADKGGPDLKYRVQYGVTKTIVSSTNVTILQTDVKQTYNVKIESFTSAGSSKAVEQKVVIFGKDKKPIARVDTTTNIIIGASVALGVLLIIAIVLILYYYRSRHPAHLKPVRLENGEVILPSGIPVYVDPTTYQDLADAVREFAKELDRDWIQLERLIGGGEFGDVYKGSLTRPLEDERTVAIKTLKSNANKKARDDFLSEAAYMGQFENPNVIGLEGVVVKDRPIMIIIEFMSNGGLDSYLQDNDGKFTYLQLLGMTRGVANGMTYLSELSFIHRDLAARNILVDENMVCKVADFGMSRELTDEETYNTTGGKIPVRWTAPEAIQFKKFTTASDVWSYGILTWEIMSYGERPYWDWGNYEVIERLASGYRLPPPMGCPKVVHDLMLSCWQKDRVKRPKFRDLRALIDKWIRSPELLKQEASVVTKRDENLDYASMKTLKEWLDSIKMGHYVENFTNKGLVTPRQILELDEENLKEIGILAIGHRNKIIKSINATKNQMNDLKRTKSLAV
eukprot:gene15419-16992_t